MMKIKMFCHKQDELSKHYALSDMPRICNDFANVKQGQYYADLTVNGHIDRQGCCVLQGVVKAILPATCQRCNELMQLKVSSEFVLSPVVDDEAASLLPMVYEPLISEDGELESLRIVEEELILSMPIVAKHDLSDCKVKKQGWHFEQQLSSSDSPFADLMEFKQNKQ